MLRRDRWVLLGVQAVVLGLPLALGGRQGAAVVLAAVAVLGLLAVTLRARRELGGPAVPGALALVGFVGLALATTAPVPPALLDAIAPAAHRLYASVLPGWPGGGDWSPWRALALEPYAVWTELTRLSIAFGVFAVVAGYPWGDEEARARVFGRLVLTLVGGGVVVAALALVAQGIGDGRFFSPADVPPGTGRAAGPFVNPNHFAAWLEMLLPVAVAYAIALGRRVGRRLVASAASGVGIGVSARRARVAALVAHQQALWAPLVATGAVFVMLAAHVASGSRGGTAALCVGLGVVVAGVLWQSSHRRVTTRVRAVLVLGVAATFLLVAGASVVRWAGMSEPTDAAALDGVDISLSSRVGLATTGWRIVRDFPVLGTGLGTWLHAYRPYLEPPVPGGVWDHAHNDFLELAAETGLVGCLLVALFALAVVRALRRRADDEGTNDLRIERPALFRPADWAAALGDVRVRWGLAGGVAAILVHSAVDFSLRLPGNSTLLLFVIGLLVLSGPLGPVRRVPALAVLTVLLAVPLLPQLANGVLAVVGAPPLAPRDCLEAADLATAEGGDVERPVALALVRRALERSPASVEAHQALADASGPGPEGEQALRRALVLYPWSPELRDRLALALLARGDAAAGAAELEESMYRLPALTSHAYLSPDLALDSEDPKQIVHALAEGDPLAVRLASLEPAVAGAIERGLDRALEGAAAGEERRAIVYDQAALLEARGRWQDAAAVLQEAAEHEPDDGGTLVRAARNFLKAGDGAAAEAALLGAVVREPEDGALYRDLAVDIYAARGDFPMAAEVLVAGERNATDLLPVYDGHVEVLRRREAALRGDTTQVAVAPQAEGSAP